MSHLQPRTLLLVEDEAMVRQLIARHLQRHGHTVVDAADAETALTLYALQHFDAVITDVHLPGMSGLDLAFALRDTRPDQPIVFVTGDLDEGLAREALAHQGAGYLLKPFEFFELDGAVRQAIAGAASRSPDAPPAPLAAATTPHDPSSAWRIEQRRLLEAAARQPVDLRIRTGAEKTHRRSPVRLVLQVIAILIVLLLVAWGIGYWIASDAHRADERGAEPEGAGTIYVPTAPRERGPDRRK